MKEDKIKKCIICKKREATDIHHKDLNHKNNKKNNLQSICSICHSELHGIEPSRNEIKRLVYYTIKCNMSKNAILSQIRSLERLEIPVPEDFKLTIKGLETIEKGYDKQIKTLLDSGKYPIWQWLEKQKGISYKLAAKLIGFININKTPKPSNLWQYCGYGDPMDKRRKGYKIRHNPILKSFVYNIAESFIKSKSPWKKIYDEEKTKQLKIVKTKMHAHRRAIRKMNKMFLLELYKEWRTVEGLPVSQSYSIDIIHNGHHLLETHEYDASHFKIETHSNNASHLLIETHSNNASQKN